MMKKIMAIVLCAIMALSVTACSSGTPKTTGKDSNGQQVVNPFVDCKTIADAEKLAGFTLTLPTKLPDGYRQNIIQAIENDLIQVLFENGEGKLEIRKAKGSGDISGDYNVYSESKTLTIGSLQVSAKGNDGKVSVATWVDGEYAYAVFVGSGETGLDDTAVSDMISGIR